MARTVARPAASRVMTSGGTGGGDPSIRELVCARTFATQTATAATTMRVFSGLWAGGALCSWRSRRLSLPQPLAQFVLPVMNDHRFVAHARRPQHEHAGAIGRQVVVGVNGPAVCEVSLQHDAPIGDGDG